MQICATDTYGSESYFPAQGTDDVVTIQDGVHASHVLRDEPRVESRAARHRRVPFSRFWVHVEYLLVNNEKMSKSAGNTYTIPDLVARGHRPSAVRYLLLSSHYRKQLNFTWDGLTQAEESLRRLTDSTGLIIAYPAATSDRLAVLRALAARMVAGQVYTEHEINQLIQQHVHPDAVDHVTLRRDLIDYQLIQRTERGTRYWRVAGSRGIPPRLDMRPPRPRVEDEGRSIYFYDDDNHMFELHTGTLADRLERYA